MMPLGLLPWRPCREAPSQALSKRKATKLPFGPMRGGRVGVGKSSSFRSVSSSPGRTTAPMFWLLAKAPMSCLEPWRPSPAAGVVEVSTNSEKVGDSVGFSTDCTASFGCSIGSSVGFSVGCSIGCSVGCFVGCSVGCPASCSICSVTSCGGSVGCFVGSVRPSNCSVGCSVGSCASCSVGSLVGSSENRSSGSCVGCSVACTSGSMVLVGCSFDSSSSCWSGSWVGTGRSSAGRSVGCSVCCWVSRTDAVVVKLCTSESNGSCVGSSVDCAGCFVGISDGSWILVSLAAWLPSSSMSFAVCSFQPAESTHLPSSPSTSRDLVIVTSSSGRTRST
mmetsp:Transcript_70969/g.229776  ORF Transcript_70969/g.229776 Transcript_70969/m.229776 type:complete len:335 (-) Transcript_70969:538-1542(-)